MQRRQEREVLISYDIENNKKRTQLLNQLKNIGMISVQKSVMWGRLLPVDIVLARRVLKEELDKDCDKAFILVVKLSEHADFFGQLPALSEYDDHAIF